jgi:diguanylate cyclase (GGDEF)-like protein
MLRKSHSFLSNNNGSLLMILNAGGYFILGAKASDEWGFMFPDRKHFRFQNAFPEVWETVAGKDHGSIGTSRGFFAFSTIKMDPEVRLKKVVAAESFWKVVSFTPASALHELTGGIRRRYLILNVFFTILSMVIAFTITVLNSIRRNAERELMLMASTDPLTGLLNRRAFLERFEYERVRSSRYDERISVILADIDHFKRVNDTLGHEAGDYVLRVIADLLRKNLREQDSICRWGGEEFIVLLPMTDLESAVETAEKLRRVVEIFRFEHKAVPIMVTMSFGVALHAPGAPVGECVQRADSHMYESKSTGRNRVSADR